MLKSSIHDVRNQSTLKIESDGSINAYIVPRPPINSNQIALPFSEGMKLNGTGTESMVINGATTNQDFYISAKSYDVYINTITFVIADASAALNQFGALASLTNGLEFYYFNQNEGKYTIESGLRTNFDMIRLANFEPAFGTGTAAFQLTNAVSASEAFVGVIDIEDVFGLQYGLRLRAQTTDRIGFIIKDNLTGLDAMNMKVYGIRM